jgi:hypothetical protein
MVLIMILRYFSKKIPPFKVEKHEISAHVMAQHGIRKCVHINIHKKYHLLVHNKEQHTKLIKKFVSTFSEY